MPLHRLLLVLLVCLAALPVRAAERVVVAYPGPLTLSFLPLDLMPRIGADRAEGIALVTRHTTGGGTALLQLQNRNADFAVAGLPAAMAAKAGGADVVAIAPVNDLAVYVLSIRSDLKGKVKRPRDLAGRVVGVTSSSLSVKTISHQLAELLLRGDGLSLNQVRIVAAGQSWEDQSAALRSKSVDAVLGFEPVASRLQDAGLAYPLFNLGNPADAATIPGAGVLQGTLETRSDVLHDTPDKAKKMVAALRRTLEWMASHTPEQIVTALELSDAGTREALVRSLRQYPRHYNPDARFSKHQLRETEIFYAATEGARQPVDLRTVVDARWAGEKP